MIDNGSVKVWKSFGGNCSFYVYGKILFHYQNLLRPSEETIVFKKNCDFKKIWMIKTSYVLAGLENCMVKYLKKHF